MKIINFISGRFRVYGLSLFTLLLFTECNDLDLQPLDAVIEENFFKTENDFKGATLASYSSMQSLYATTAENLFAVNEWWKLTIMTEDNVTSDPFNIDLLNYSNFRVFPTTTAFPFIYTIVYQGVHRANKVLQKLEDENELTAEEKTQYEAEAKFLRAWFHFQSFKIWGGYAPLSLAVVDDLTNSALPNSTPAETISAILADFQFAADNLPESWDSQNTGRATAWAAIAYLGKTHLYNGDLSAAQPFFQDVYDNGPYSLMADYASVFDYDFENNQESIFEIQFASNSDDNGWVLDDFHTENFKASQGYHRGADQDTSNGSLYEPSVDYVNSSDPDDPRLSTNIYREGDTYFGFGFDFILGDITAETGSTGYLIKKYRGENIAKMAPLNFVVDYNNERIFRFADLILMYAETLIESDPTLATQLINEVRLRSFPAATAVPAGLSTADLTDALRLERRLELAFEGHRYFDLVRWGIAQETFDALDTAEIENTWGTQTSNGIFPLPQTEIDRSGGVLSQIDGL